MVILVDMDDTIEALLDAWLDKINKKYGRSVSRDDIVSWDTTSAFPGLTKDEVYGILLDNEFWKDVKPIPGAAEALEHFISEGHSVYIVTATHYSSLRGKMEYLLFKYFPFIPWDNVIITSRKQMIKGDVLIDDGVHNLIGGDFKKILVDAPYNRDFDAEANGMIRVYNWTEIRKIIDGMGK